MNINTKPYNWSLLYTNKDLQKKFDTDFKRKFNTYTKDVTDCNIIYQEFSKTTLETANENIQLKPKLNKRVSWENSIISEKHEYLKCMSLFKRRAPDTYNVICIIQIENI